MRCVVGGALHGEGPPPRVGAHLATRNPRDFPLVELEVELWPVG